MIPSSKQTVLGALRPSTEELKIASKRCSLDPMKRSSHIRHNRTRQRKKSVFKLKEKKQAFPIDYLLTIFPGTPNTATQPSRSFGNFFFLEEV